MQEVYYVGLDVHKKSVSACVKRADGTIVEERAIAARPRELCAWAETLPSPWRGGMEATLFTGWIYDVLSPYAASLTVGHPAMMRAIGASKKKSDRLDAQKIADLVRCDLMPACYMAPRELRDLRRALRYRNFLVRQAVTMKNKTAGLLMETGCEYDRRRLHGKRYFAELLEGLETLPDSVAEMLTFNRHALALFQKTQKRIIGALEEHPLLARRVALLQSIDGVGQVLSLTWALEVGDPHRFTSIDRAVSYCGLCAAQRESAGKAMRGPLSKLRNKHLQQVLVEAAKLAPRWNASLAALHERELAKGNKNRASLAVARKLVAYLLAVDKSGRPFVERGAEKKEVN